MRHLTRIVSVPIGVNLLGLLEVFAFIGLLLAAIVLADHIHKLVQLALLVCSVGGVVVFDLWWRCRQPEATRWGRLLSPFAGGCFCYLPIWVLLPGCVAVGIITVILNNTG